MKKALTLGLAGFFLISAAFCCCLADVAQAAEPMPSCHQQQTDGHERSSSEPGDCECDQTPAVLVSADSLSDLSGAMVFAAAILPGKKSPALAFRRSADQIPPPFYDTSPLYIKHSILRI